MRIFRIPLVFIASSLFYIPWVTHYCFGPINLDQVLFFIFTENGTIGTDPVISSILFKYIIEKPALITVCVLIVYGLLRRFKYWPASFERAVVPLLAITLVVGAVYNIKALDGFSIVKRFTGNDQMADYFQPYSFENIEPRKRHNLILLYVESLENTFSDATVMGRNLNAPLERELGQSPYKLHQALGTSWTTAGMVASQCGVPLASFMGNRLGHRNQPILKNLTCVSDVLANFDYNQTFFVGPDLKFSGMDKFYLSHRFDNAFGRDEIFEQFISSDFATGWGRGVNDDIVMDLAFDQIKQDFKAKQNFNVTIVTTDNRAANGWLSPRCDLQGFDRQLSEVIWCTNETIVKFINRLEALGVFENTVLVIMGDHLFMGDIDAPYERTIYFNYLGADSKDLVPQAFDMTHFDVFPTALQLVLGLQVSHLHLGFSIFG